MTLRLNGIEATCIIGDLPDERVRPQTLRIDVELEIPPAAAESDRLCDTVDYAALADSVRQALVDAKCRMVERAARVAFLACEEACRPVAGARPLRVAVAKSGAVSGLASASVCYP